MEIRWIAVFTAMLVGFGCSHSVPKRDPLPAADKHEVDNRYVYTSCKVDEAKKRVLFWQKRAADRVYLYALMSSNAYTDEKQYEIPGWTRTDRFSSTSGLAFDEYVRDGSSPLELVVAFRGTERSLKDWKANAALIEPWQHREAYEYIARRRKEQPDAHMTVTGHSLGGALALNMSTRFDNLPAFAFNSSPRAFFAAQGIANERTLVWETGEILNSVRRPWLGARMRDAERLRFNFMSYRIFRSLKFIREHGIYGLSRGLLISAVAYGNPHAKEVFDANILQAGVPAAEIEACEVLPAQAPPP